MDHCSRHIDFGCRLATIAGLVIFLGLAGCSGCESSPKTDSDVGGDTTKTQQTDATEVGPETGASNDEAAADGDAQTNQVPSAESEKSATITEKPPLEIEGLLTVDDVRTLAGGTDYEQAELLGQSPGPDYNAVRFRPENQGDYGAGLQVWKFADTSSAASRFDTLKNQYLDVSEPGSETNVPGQRAFMTERGGIKQLVIELEQPPRILAVSCSPDLCESNSSLAELASTAVKRLRDQNE